ncbi:MAG: phage holin family protein [Actinomycetota bacterium]|nr:phage holin family protein [Actinomycetota bacterium]
MAADPTPNGSRESSPQIAAAVQEISERASLLVREEIELAKAEVSEKVNKLIRGAVVGTAAGVFAIFGVSILLQGLAWLLYALVFDDIYWGFFVVAGLLFLLAGLAAFLAVRWFKGGAPPTPDMAIDEAQRIRDTLTGEPGGQLDAVAARAEADRS